MAYFSILIPVFNQVGKMDRCVSSIMEQTFGDFEVVFVNDGSTDDSLSMLNGYAAKDPRFRVVSHEQNQSLLAARFTGMREASGKVIVFLDSDDYIEKTMLMEIRDKYEETGADIIRYGLVAEPEGRTWVPSPCEDLLAGYLDGQFPPGIVKNAYAQRVIRGAIETGESFYCNMGEDSYLAGVFYGNAESHADMDRVFYHYIFEGGMSALSKNNNIKKIQKQYDSSMASGTHLIAFMKKYRPEYAEKAKKVLMNMLDYVLLTNLYAEEDPVNAIRCVALYDREDTQDLFEKACRGLLRKKYLKTGREGGFGEQFVTDPEF